MPPQLPPESHYDPKKLDKIFGILAVVLLVSLIGIFAKDYIREWKDYQRQFRALEVEKTRIKIDEQINELAKNEEYQNILKDLTASQGKLNSQLGSIRAIEQKITAAETALKRHTQQSQFAKAEYDALKYKTDLAEHNHASNAVELKNKLTALKATIESLQLKVEEDTRLVRLHTDTIKGIQQSNKDLEKKRLGIAKKKEIIERKLKRIDIQEMSPANQLAEMVRDLPIIDLANPNYKIRQIVVKDIPEDVNFMKIPRVDRCTTCHLGIDNPDFKDAAQPFKTHSNLELFVGKNSNHPMDDFACTTCHLGRGRATDFISAVHTPRNEEQKKEWEKKYKWHALEHWEQPMLPAQFTQASCFKCHEGQEIVKGAEKLNLGIALIERAGCYGCHTITKFTNWPKTGPSLEFLASKTTKQWAYHWIADPKSIRSDTWMPSYFNQSNNNDPASIKRSEQEVLSMANFLFNNSKPFTIEPVALEGDSKKGKELVSSLGCMACHQVKPMKADSKRTRDSLHQEFGPNLIGLGSKTSKEWLVDWLKDPKRYHGQTRMPNMRLNDQEASDIAAYMVQDKSSVTDAPVPAVNEQILDTIVLDFLKKSEHITDAQAKIKTMDAEAKLNFAGQRLIREYGCYSCHKIPGFENEKPIGVELTQEGSKSIERLDFGFIHLEHTKQAWFEQKIKNPRIFDTGRTLAPLERLKMPNFNLSHEETEAITTVIMGLVKDKPDSSKMPNQGTKASFINEGQKVVRQFNCQGCHTIEGEGSSVKGSVKDWLMDYQGKSDSEAATLVDTFAPPNLFGEGAKVQAQWLFEFIHQPITIRPWLQMRMPSYGFGAGQINSLVKYFNYLDGEEFPFTDIYHPNLNKEEFQAAEKLFSKDVFACGQCHIVGSQMPFGSQDSWAPNLALASQRLKPEWIVKWLTNPPAIMPGTKMPTFFDPNAFEDSGPPDILDGDERRQIRALRDYLLTISSTIQDASKDEQKPKDAIPALDAPAK